MTPFLQFMELNRSIILFIYGLVFFLLGTTLALQSRSYSRLELARSLKWLAAFGLLHGLYEWGDLFIPLQSPNLGRSTQAFWSYVQGTLLALSFTCLFQFGISIFRPTGRYRWVTWVPTLLFILWAGMAVWVAALPGISWRATVSAPARYFISFPASLLAAYGLYCEAHYRLARLNAPHIIWNLRIAAVSLALYALFSGLIVMPVTFSPGNWLNTATFSQTIGIPPLVFRSVLGLVLTISMIRALEVFELEYERQVETMERQQILAVERERLARDLHDGAIQSVYSASLLIESAAQLADPDSLLATRLTRAGLALNSAISDLRQSLVELRGTPSTHSFPEALQALACSPQYTSLVDIHLDLDLPHPPAFSAFTCEHVLAIVKEALANIIRHARAKQVIIRARFEHNCLMLAVQDDGIGLPSTLQPGFGLRNMRDRARLLGGEIVFSPNQAGKGTTVTLQIPWGENDEPENSRPVGG